MYKIIAFMGQSGAGKDSLMQGVLAKNPELHEIVSCTTRPPREGEINGVNYYFYSREQFEDKILNGEMLEVACFNDWLYGTAYESLRSDCLNIGVFSPAGIRSLIFTPDIEILIFYITASDKIRLLRQLNREESPDVCEIIRRFSADKKDFSSIDFDTIQVANEKNNNLDNSIELISETIHSWALGRK